MITVNGFFRLTTQAVLSCTSGFVVLASVCVSNFKNQEVLEPFQANCFQLQELCKIKMILTAEFSCFL